VNLKYLISSALISTSLFAAENSVDDTATLSLDEAATRIQRRFRLPLDKKLHGIKDELSKEACELRQRTGGDLVLIDGEIQKYLDSLSASSNFKSVAMLAALLSRKIEGLDVAHHLKKYESYLDQQISEGSDIEKQFASVMKAGIRSNIGNEETKLNEMRDLLEGATKSPYPAFRWYSYGLLSGAAKTSGDRDQALNYLYRGMGLPKRYHADIYSDLAELDDSENYRTERYWEKIVKIGTSEERMVAFEKLENLANLYGNKAQDLGSYEPTKKALDFYQYLITAFGHTSEKGLSYLSKAAHLLVYGNLQVRDIGRAVRVCNKLREHSTYKRSSLAALASIYQYDPDYKNLSEAIKCHEELVLLHENEPFAQYKSLVFLLESYKAETGPSSSSKIQGIPAKIKAIRNMEGFENSSLCQVYDKTLSMNVLKGKNHSETGNRGKKTTGTGY
jgi:hypothetical protein